MLYTEGYYQKVRIFKTIQYICPLKLKIYVENPLW
jgi:hypothetical protein